jgi:anti-sigma factor RsiW
MSAGPDHQRLRPEDRANLVAYVDGELAEAEARVLSTKITHSATARREVELLKKTWDALDKLPRPRVSDQFHDRTLSYIRSIELRKETRLAPFSAAFQGIGRLAACLLVAGAAGVGGYLAVRGLWPDADRRLAQELSLAEHLEEYQEVGDFDLLDALKRSPDFGASRR